MSIEGDSSGVEWNQTTSNVPHDHEMDEHGKEINYSDHDCYVTSEGKKMWSPKCDEKLKPYLNQSFSTIEDGLLFYKEYGRACGFDVRLSTGRSNRCGKIVSKWIQCSNAGQPTFSKQNNSEDVDESSTKRRKTSSRRCGCLAKIILRFIGKRGYVVMSFTEDHNHDFASDKSKMFLRCNRNVSFGHQKFIVDCARANIGPTRAHGLTKEMVGSYGNVGATASDFRNFSRDIKARIGEYDADMILKKFKIKREASNNIFFYDYKVDEEGHLTGLFWADSVAQTNFKMFGDIVSFDPTFRTNKYKMVFVPFTGVDNHWKNVTFAAALLQKEDYNNFKWLIRCFQKAMGRAPPCVITDQCPAIRKALARYWSKSKHRLCMWHIMTKLPGKVGPVLSSNKKFMDKLKSVVWADHLSVEDFEEGWKTTISEYNLETNTWLQDMYDLRQLWIPAYFNDIEMAGLLRTTSRSESSNSFFQHFHESGATLVEFFSNFESSMDRQRYQNSENDRKSELNPQTETTMKIEKDAAELYTRRLYRLVTEEIKGGCYNTSITNMTRDQVSRFFEVQDDLMRGTTFQVSVTLADHSVHCSCNYYFRRGYLCRHAFAALKQCNVTKIPRKFVNPRWSKDAMKRLSMLGYDPICNHSAQLNRIKLKQNKAWYAFQSCMNLVGDDDSKIDTVLKCLDEIKSDLTDPNSNNTIQGNINRVDRFVGPKQNASISVHIPNVSRNKGCGNRIKSGREISTDEASSNRRKCSRCGKKDGHNLRTCPLKETE